MVTHMVVHILPSRISHVSYEYELIRQHTKDFRQAVGDGSRHSKSYIKVLNSQNRASKDDNLSRMKLAQN